MNNLLDSFTSKEDALRVTSALDRVLGDLGLNSRGWSHSGEPPLQEESLDGVSLDLMGIRWFSLTKTIQIKIPRLHFGQKRKRGRMDPNVEYFEGDFGKMAEFVPKLLTRRQIVSKRAGIYDLLGKISPVLARLKCLRKR